MTDKITLTDIINLQNENTAVSAINSNSHLITSAFDNTLSRDGTQPNQMGAVLDMNSNQIINLPAPSTVDSPARVIDVVTNPTIVIPGTGTSGHVVPYLDGTNTWSAPQTFSSGIFQNLGSFFAHNNNVDFTWTPPNPNIYHLFTPSTTKFNQGSYWANNRFTPPTGTNVVYLGGSIFVTSASTFSGSFVAKWIKNFTIDGNGNQLTGQDVFAGLGGATGNIPGAFFINAVGFDRPSPGDYYGLFLFLDAFPLGSTSVTVDGNLAHTYVQGIVLA